MENGKKRAFEEIYDKNFDLIRFYLRKLNVNSAQLDDLTQECFFRLLKNIDSVDLERAKPYLFSIARNLVNDEYRKKRSRKTSSYGEEEPAVDVGLWVSDEIRDMECSIVGDLIDEFSAQDGHECFGLFYREGLSMKDISSRLDIPMGTVSSRLARLREKFSPIAKAHLKG